MGNEPRTIELWEGYTVTVNEDLLDDFDFMKEFNEAVNNADLGTMTAMQFALVGGDKVYQDVRQHIEAENNGRFSLKAITGITKKIMDAFPKAGNRASRRSW